MDSRYIYIDEYALQLHGGIIHTSTRVRTWSAWYTNFMLMCWCPRTSSKKVRAGRFHKIKDEPAVNGFQVERGVLLPLPRHSVREEHDPNVDEAERRRHRQQNREMASMISSTLRRAASQPKPPVFRCVVWCIRQYRTETEKTRKTAGIAVYELQVGTGYIQL